MHENYSCKNTNIVDVTPIFNCFIIPIAATSLQKYQKPYAGVVVFHLPCALEVGMNIDDTTTFRVSVWSSYSSCKVGGVNNLLVCTLNITCYIILSMKVDQMIAYALGEMVKPVDSGEGGSEELRMNMNCYEIVTAWVHPRWGRIWDTMLLFSYFVWLVIVTISS